MPQPDISEIQGKNNHDMDDQEVLEFLDYKIEEKGRRPKVREWDKEEWGISHYAIREEFDTLNNALWRLGRDYNEKLAVKDEEAGREQSIDERTELIQHELRTIEHRKGRSPSIAETIHMYQDYKDIRKRAGIPYEPLTRKFQGIIDSEREDQLVKMLFEDYKDPETLIRNKDVEYRGYDQDEKAAQYEIEAVLEAYAPWIDEYR